MTDKEIIKALEICNNCDSCQECKGFFDSKYCIGENKQQIIDLIKKLKNREKRYQKKIKFQRSALRKQQEEINCFADVGKMYSEIRAEARAEAIKEFADKLREQMRNGVLHVHLYPKDIDDMVKEMLGEEIEK